MPDIGIDPQKAIAEWERRKAIKAAEAAVIEAAIPVGIYGDDWSPDDMKELNLAVRELLEARCVEVDARFVNERVQIGGAYGGPDLEVVNEA